MQEPDTFDDTSHDHDRFEAALLAQDRDAAGVATADVDNATARSLVAELVEDGVVTSVRDERLLVHDPSGAAFDSITQLAVYHRGWTAGQAAREGGR